MEAQMTIQMLECYTLSYHLRENYRKVASSNTSRLEAHAGYLRLLMKDIFFGYVM
jgi:hypothetical protein